MSTSIPSHRRRVIALIAVAIAVTGAWATITVATGRARPVAVSHGVIARIAAAPSVPKLGSTGLVYGGFSSQQWASFFQITKGGKMLTAAGIGLDMSCSQGDSFSMPDNIKSYPIGRGGHLDAKYVVPLSTVNGVQLTGQGEVKATFDPHGTKVTGTWHAQITFIPASGPEDSCDSGTVRFTARQ
jgi:hypothetical protein